MRARRLVERKGLAIEAIAAYVGIAALAWLFQGAIAGARRGAGHHHRTTPLGAARELLGRAVEGVLLAGCGHNDLHLDPRSGEALRDFLDRRL